MVDSVGDDKDFIALNYFNNKISYNELFYNINICAKALREYGVRKGDVVTICCPNMPEALYVFYACNKIGAVADMVHPLSSPEQLLSYLNNSKSRILVLVDFNYDKMKDAIEKTLVYKTVLVSPKESMPMGLTIGYTLTRSLMQKRPKLDDNRYISWKEFMGTGLLSRDKYRAKVDKDDLAIILHSGGTTGTPKGIMISNYSFNALAQQSAVNVIEVRPKEKILTLLPIFHGFGLGVCVHTPLCLKVETILMPEYDANRFYKIWKYDKPNVILGVPTLWEGMMSNKKFDNVDMSQLKYIVNGGDYLTLSAEARINDFLHRHGAKVDILKGYGMTESVAATAYTFPGTNEPGSIGIPMVGNKYMVCDPETMEEYIAPNGIIYYTQRLKRMIVVSGFNVYPSSIEEVIAKHPDVDKVCVIGIAHKYKMHVPKAFIVLKKGIEPTAKIKKEIIDLCKESLSVYSLPKYYEFRDSLPKTLYNKVDYKKLEKEEETKIRH